MRLFIELLLSLLSSWVKPAPKPTPVDPKPGPHLPEIARKLLEIHNANRSSPLAENSRLTKAAQDHANWMAANRRMSHRGAGFSSPGARIKAAGYDWTTYGENVAYGQSTPEQVMGVWLRSPGHRRNIKSGAYTEIGLGYATASTGQIYWCVTFGNRAYGSFDWSESWCCPTFTTDEED